MNAKIILPLIALTIVVGVGGKRKARPEKSKQDQVKPSKTKPGQKAPSSQPSQVKGLRVLSFDRFPGTNTAANLYCSDNLRSASEIVVYLHGDNLNSQGLQEIIDRHDLESQIARLSKENRRRSVWIVPHATGKCVEFMKAFSSPEKTKEFIDAVVTQTKSAGITFDQAPNEIPLVLSGQSRARLPLKLFLKQRAAQVTEIYLFDALYDSEAAYAEFALRPKTKFWTVYSEHTLKHVKKLFELIHGTPKQIYSDQDLGSASFASIQKPIPLLEEYKAGGSLDACFNGFSNQDRDKPIGFVSSSVEHKYTTRYYLAAVMG